MEGPTPISALIHAHFMYGHLMLWRDLLLFLPLFMLVSCIITRCYGGTYSYLCLYSCCYYGSSRYLSRSSLTSSFQALPLVIGAISWTGAATALLGATIAFAQRYINNV